MKTAAEVTGLKDGEWLALDAVDFRAERQKQIPINRNTSDKSNSAIGPVTNPAPAQNP